MDANAHVLSLLLVCVCVCVCVSKCTSECAHVRVCSWKGIHTFKFEHVHTYVCAHELCTAVCVSLSFESVRIVYV